MIVSMTLFVNRVSVDVIKDLEMSSFLIRVDPNPMTGVFLRGRFETLNHIHKFECGGGRWCLGN